MEKQKLTRAARLVTELNTRRSTLIEQGLLAPAESNRRIKATQEVDTPEMREKRRKAVAKLRTFLD